jgi:hypothetical protein
MNFIYETKLRRPGPFVRFGVTVMVTILTGLALELAAARVQACSWSSPTRPVLTLDKKDVLAGLFASWDAIERLLAAGLGAACRFLSELHPRSETQLGVDVGQVCLHGSR